MDAFFGLSIISKFAKMLVRNIGEYRQVIHHKIRLKIVKRLMIHYLDALRSLYNADNL